LSCTRVVSGSRDPSTDVDRVRLDPSEWQRSANIELSFLLKPEIEQLGLSSFQTSEVLNEIQLYGALNTPATYEGTQPFARWVAELIEKTEAGPCSLEDAEGEAYQERAYRLVPESGLQDRRRSIRSLRKQQDPCIDAGINGAEVAPDFYLVAMASVSMLPLIELRRTLGLR
jgi:hypothetical protein